MNTCIKEWLDAHPSAKQWLWFVALWFAGLGSVLAIAYPLKFLIKLAG